MERSTIRLAQPADRAAIDAIYDHYVRTSTCTFQEVPDEASLHEAILAALEEVPNGTRVFVISRTEPSARYARLGANRALMLVDWEQLKLTTDESLSILRSSGIALDAPTCRGLLERAGGWAAGLVLLVERLRHGGAFESFTEPDSLQQVFAYFAGQLFDKASKENQLTLLRLSYLPSVSERMAEQLTGEINSRRLLEHSLDAMGYAKVPTVTEVAQYSVRGGIVDLYGFGMAQPVRCEWWGDTLVSLRSFDLTTQRSGEEFKSVTALPVRVDRSTIDIGAGPSMRRSLLENRMELFRG